MNESMENHLFLHQHKCEHHSNLPTQLFSSVSKVLPFGHSHLYVPSTTAQWYSQVWLAGHLSSAENKNRFLKVQY